MKPRTDIAHIGTIGRKGRVDMTFDQNSLAHLMAVLTDLYSDPELAVIREYSTNGFDSHIDAGNPDPIEIELPTSLRRIFVVRDFGLGMSETDVTENFSKYGYSSKRDTDEQVGMLGLGCKSALTYSSQFTFIATKDGEQVTVLVTRNEDGAGALQLIDKRAVKAPNGVEVQIPVKGDVKAFNDKANDFFKYWNPETVKINGQMVKSIWDAKVQKDEGITVLDNDLLLLPNQVAASYGRGAIYNSRTGRYEYPGRNRIVMGNVPYPHEGNLSDMLSGAIVARVPVGSINFTPSREALQDTALTRGTLERIKDRVTTVTVNSATTDVSSAPTAFEALQRRNKWLSVTNNKLGAGLTWNGKAIPDRLENDIEKTMEWSTGYYNQNGLTLGTRAQRFERHIPTRNIDAQTLCVTHHKAKSLAKGTKERIISHINYLAEQSNDPEFKITRCYLTDEDPYGKWCTHKISLEELKKYAITKTPRKAASTSFRVLTANGKDERVEELEDSDKKVIVPAGDGSVVREAVAAALSKVPGYIGVIVASNRIEAFKKKQKNTLSVKEFAEERLKEFNQSLSPLETWFVAGANVNGYYNARDCVIIPGEIGSLISSFASLGDEPVDDPDVKKAKEAINAINIDGLRNRTYTLMRLCSAASVPCDLRKRDKAAEPVLTLCKDLRDRYPLLKYSLSRQEAVDYVNQTHFYINNK